MMLSDSSAKSSATDEPPATGATESVAWLRNRWVYAISIPVIVALGLASRRYTRVLPHFLQKNAGDALWALMVFLIVGWLFPRRSTAWTAGIAMTFSVLIEFSQLYHAPWIDQLRSYTLGHLVLGSGFGWSDMLCYATGIAAGMIAERVIQRITLNSPADPRSPCVDQRCDQTHAA